MNARKRGMVILCSLIGWSLVNLISIAIFSFGYFSLQEKLYETQPLNLKRNFEENSTYHKMKWIESYCSFKLQSAQFSKLTFIVIDALRADLFSSFHKDKTKDSMPFLKHLLQTNQAKFFTSIAQTPTVTMPRIKALLAGIKPHYIDLLMNLNSARFQEDNLLNQAHRKRKRLIFYGDDTWLNMFSSDLFLRYNVTYSFFATDYIQVDTNVTDNLLLELKKLNEWDYLFLHYLGVDHIGHTYGPQSFLMPKKLNEMDSIIELLFEVLSKSEERYLIVITGDHGMTDKGNHGGSSSQEFETGLIFIDTKINNNHPKTSRPKQTSVKQVDIAVTLSLLLGLDIPKKSNGKIIFSLMDWLSVESDLKKCYLFYNSMQIAHIYCSKQLVIEYFEPALKSHFEIINKKSKNISSAKNFYIKFISKIQENILAQKDSRNFFLFIFQCVSIAIGFLCAFKMIIIDINGNYSIISSTNYNDPLILFTVMIMIFRTLLLASTSFIEMENYFWSYISSTLVLLSLFRFLINNQNIFKKFANIFKSLPANQFLQIASHFVILLIIRFYNFTNEIFEDSFINSNNKHFSTSVVIVSLIAISFMVSTYRFTKQQCFLISGLFWVYLYRCDLESLASFRWSFKNFIPYLSPTFKARIVYLHLIVIIIENWMKHRHEYFSLSFIDDFLPTYSMRINKKPCSTLRCFITCWVLLSALLTKPHNIPLLALTVWMEKLIFYIFKWSLSSQSAILFTFTYLTFSYTCFFSAGNSNSISTLNVSAGYTGLNFYNPFLVGLLMTCYTYSLPIFWHMMLFTRLYESKSLFNYIPRVLFFKSLIVLLLVIRFVSLSFFQVILIFFSNHLFIWNVITPKFLYEAFQTFLTMFLIILFIIVIVCDNLVANSSRKINQF